MSEQLEKEPVAKFPTTGSLEPFKIKFFSQDNQYMEDLKDGKFQVFFTKYKYSDEYAGKPTFVINNLISGFVQQLESKRKYLFISFKCTKDPTYNIEGVWITNCTLSMDQIVPEKYDDFEWEELKMDKEEDCDRLTDLLKKDTDTVTNCYLH